MVNKIHLGAKYQSTFGLPMREIGALVRADLKAVAHDGEHALFGCSFVVTSTAGKKRASIHVMITPGPGTTILNLARVREEVISPHYQRAPVYSKRGEALLAAVDEIVNAYNRRTDEKTARFYETFGFDWEVELGQRSELSRAYQAAARAAA